MEILWQYDKEQIEIQCPHCASGLAVFAEDLFQPNDINGFYCFCKVCHKDIEVDGFDVPEYFFPKEKKIRKGKKK